MLVSRWVCRLSSWSPACGLPRTGISTEAKLLFLLPHASYSKKLCVRKKLVSLFLLFGKCQDSSYSPNMNYWKYEGHLMLKPKTMLFVGIFLFQMTQTWPSSQERFGSLPGSDALAVGVCWEEGCVLRTSGECTVHPMNGTNLAQACLAPCLLVPQWVSSHSVILAVV